ncbi:MAG: hypothetical protein ABIT04_09340 [Novosphingobium sp.]
MAEGPEMSVRRLPLVLGLMVIFLAGALSRPADSYAAPVQRSATTASLRVAAASVVRALQHRNGGALAGAAHPGKGVRFSPGAFVDPAHDVVLSRAAIRRLWTDPRVYKWGYTDGAGEPIELTPAQYVARYTLPQRTIAPTSVSVDRDRAQGNSTNNAATAYPRARRVEYYWNRLSPSADPQYDCLAVRLIFEPIKGSWFLVAIVRERWGP